jgi:hypothetical protein
MASLLTWIANDPDLLPAHVQFHKSVEGSLLGNSGEVCSMFEADGVRAQLRSGGADAEHKIDRNQLCVKGVLIRRQRNAAPARLQGPCGAGGFHVCHKERPTTHAEKSVASKFLMRIQICRRLNR